MSDRERIVCMAIDAMRLCLGIRPRTYSPQEIARFIDNLAKGSANV